MVAIALYQVLQRPLEEEVAVQVVAVASTHTIMEQVVALEVAHLVLLKCILSMEELEHLDKVIMVEEKHRNQKLAVAVEEKAVLEEVPMAMHHMAQRSAVLVVPVLLLVVQTITVQQELVGVLVERSFTPLLVLEEVAVAV